MEQEWFQITKHPAQAITPKKSRFNRLRGLESLPWIHQVLILEG